jgi:hypothetical protein
MIFIALFFAGAFLCNAFPHLAAGLMGQGFPTPFAKPSGIGLSSPVVNFLLGTFNLVAGSVLLVLHPLPGLISPETGVLLAGFVLLGLFCAHHFGKARDARGG